MTRNRSSISQSQNCVLCSQEISVNKEICQPNNPRAVFKVCTKYLRPEVFTKHSKWEDLSGLERQSPFCSMCVKSGEKLCAMNNRLEEIQKEIKSFVKYFRKEIFLLNVSEEDENSDNEVEDVEKIEVNKRYLRSSTNNNLSNREKESFNSTAGCVPVRTITITSKSSDSSPENELVVIKQEIDEPEETAGYDDDYAPPSSPEEEEDEDEDYSPKTKKPNTSPESCNSNNTNVKVQHLKIAATQKKRRVPWKEISYSEEKLKLEWSRKSVNNNRGHRNVTEYFYCKLGGKKCPCKLMKRSYGGIRVRYYLNDKDHYHVKNRGVSQEIKSEVQKIIQDDPMAKPDCILEILESKGIELQKMKLNNILVKERRKVLIENGLYDPIKASQKRTVQNGEKRKRGRPTGSSNIIIPLSVPVPETDVQPPPPGPPTDNAPHFSADLNLDSGSGLNMDILQD